MTTDIATLQEAKQQARAGGLLDNFLPVSALVPNDYNPNHMTDERFAELVEEVKHLDRLPKPIVVRPNGDGRYAIVDGEHGWRAAQKAGLSEIPVEIVEADDFEARRQTYKRNQHGEHNPVLLGRMFRQMMEERSLSQRALAKEIAVSEGTVRNALVYAEAVELRNRYAQAEGLDEPAEASTALVAGLSIRQVRYYAQLPQMSGGYWLDAGADVRTLLGVKTDAAVEHADTQIEDAAGNVGKYFARLEATGLFEFTTRPHSTEGFKKAIEAVEKWDKWESSWCWGFIGNCLTRKALRPYTRHHFRGVFYVREMDREFGPHSLMDSALDLVVNTHTKPPSFYLTPEEFEKCIQGLELLGGGSATDFQAALRLTVKEKHGDVRPREQHQARWELMAREIKADAPDYIKDSLLGLELKFYLWKLEGSEEAKRRLAKRRYIGGNRDTKDNVKRELEAVEWEVKGEQRSAELRAELESKTKSDLATQLAERLYSEHYKDNPDAMTKVATRLSKLEKVEILALDEVVRKDQAFQEHIQVLNALAQGLKGG